MAAWQGRAWNLTVDNRWLLTLLALMLVGLCFWHVMKDSVERKAKGEAATLEATATRAKAEAASLAAKAAAARATAGKDAAGIESVALLEATASDARARAAALDEKAKAASASADQLGKRIGVGTIVSLVLLACLVGWFLDIFNGDATPAKVKQMVTFCYIFPFAIFAGILIPLFAYPVALPDPPKPVGIILGCNDRPIAPADKELVPDGISCYNNTDQWLVNIGGHAEYLSDTKRRQGEATLEAAEKDRTAARATARARAQSDGSTTGKSAANPGAKGDRGKSEPAADGKSKSAPQARSEPETQTKSEPATQTKGESAALAKSEPGKGEQKSTSQRTAAEARKEAQEGPFDVTDQFRITGGLVVPLYFVMLAIFGGFVSMLRRVPEYQERLSPGASDPLSNERAREKLVFEVLQLLAAPLIAVTAYYLIDPTSRASSIALAFIAGFSSETVLLYVRALTEKLQPDTMRRTQSVEVVPTSVDFKTQTVNTTSPPQVVTLRNRTASVISGTVTPSADFACAPAGQFSATPGDAFSFSVTFKPTSVGKKRGQLHIVDNGPNSPRIVNLEGEGTAPVQSGNPVSSG